MTAGAIENIIEVIVETIGMFDHIDEIFLRKLIAREQWVISNLRINQFIQFHYHHKSQILRQE
ncbi:unannotated protein [freshwater metagenome]|uniref:Unannotated protein n=1 Tax=freshwater metagenome TaxID=449393 RepID=A0A6J6EF38_9ZZZZ